MIGEIVAFVVLFVGVVFFGAVAWRLTLHVIGVDPQEVAIWRARVREFRRPASRHDASLAAAPPGAGPSGSVERVARVLALLEETPETRRRSV